MNNIMKDNNKTNKLTTKDQKRVTVLNKAIDSFINEINLNKKSTKK